MVDFLQLLVYHLEFILYLNYRLPNNTEYKLIIVLRATIS